MTTSPAGTPRPTADSITDDELDALLEDRQRLAAYIAQLRKTSVEDVLAEARRQAAEERTRPRGDRPDAAGLPDVQGRCPACGGSSLFLGEGGYVTCRRLDCAESDAASTLLERSVR